MCYLFSDEAQKVDQIENKLGPIKLYHSEFNVRREIEGSDESNFITQSFNLLSHFESDHCTIRVSYKDVRTARLLFANCLQIYAKKK